MNWDTTLWMVLMVGFVIAEGACPFHLVSVWFAVGSLASMIVALLAGPFWLQLLLFFLISIALLAATLPLSRKLLNAQQTQTNVDSIIGSMGYVTETVDNLNAIGQVKLGGMYWTARSDDGHTIPTGTLVEVTRIEGVKAFVTPVPVEDELEV